ncbi:hypothetical protein EI546_13425 [Aequorivita sp. H23M31]|uniref:Uncharacterized protein n=1 Tax=Aequorivita ciconiae TaxID=2494375 RepID=A0A410G5V0_9FLAO|nr:hypothetical protein [Aequorivita sp. H23M31]QAA82657.1 hypothetical protein EI546_13425 [Aequorivita sp. H23M31]
MKYSFPFLILVTFSFFQISCLNNLEEDSNYHREAQLSENRRGYKTEENRQGPKRDTIVYYNNIDPQSGMIMSRIPLPSNWKKQNDKEFSYLGPNGIKIYNERASMYMFSNDQQTNQMYQQSGIPIQFPKSIEQVINESFVPYGNKINRKLVGKFPIPQLATWDKQYEDQKYKSLPSQKTFTVMGLEWQDPDGTKLLTVLHHFVSYDNYGGYWGVIYTILESSEGAYEKAKRQYINGLLNKQVNPQWIQKQNKKDMQIAQQSNIDHQIRMDNIKAAGERSTANHNARMATMDQNMTDWKYRQAANDRSHSQVIDNIRGTTNVSDHSTGQAYKVESGAKQYWVNDQGEYIMSDNSLYNPNQDKWVNNQNWTEFEEQN